MQKPKGFVDKQKPNYVCKLRKAIVGLKQAPLLYKGLERTRLIRALYIQHLKSMSQSKFLNALLHMINSQYVSKKHLPFCSSKSTK